MSLESRPNHFGGACTTLAPGVAEKYFDADQATDPFYVRTAKAICAHCPIQEMCLAEAMEDIGSTEGVVGGYTRRELYNLERWEAYDLGLRAEKPHFRRPTMVQEPASLKTADRPAFHARPTLSFTEQVYAIFIDVKRGKYRTLNEALGEIALVHGRIVEEVRKGGEMPQEIGA